MLAAVSTDAVAEAGWQFCRLRHNGAKWSNDWPTSDRRITDLIEFVTLVRMKAERHANIGPENIDRCPLVYASNADTMALNSAQVLRMRRWLARGGLLWTDGFVFDGRELALGHEIAKLVPGARWVPIERDHIIWNSPYKVQGLWQTDYAETRVEGVFDDDGRLMILMTNNTAAGSGAVGDSWEHYKPGTGMPVGGFGFGVNVLMYAMTH